jgi:hypothetical protein
MAVTKLAIDLDRRREARADDERIRCASTLRKFLGKFLVEHPQPGSERHYRLCSTHHHGFALPRCFEICHRLLAALGIAAIMWVLRNAGGNRPEPRLTGRREWVKHYPTNRSSILI